MKILYKKRHLSTSIQSVGNLLYPPHRRELIARYIPSAFAIKGKSHIFTLTKGYSLYLVNYTLEIFIQNTEDDQVHLYRKSARGPLQFMGTASTFAMFLHSMPDLVGHDVIAGLTGNLSNYHSRGHTELIINYLNNPP